MLRLAISLFTMSMIFACSDNDPPNFPPLDVIEIEVDSLNEEEHQQDETIESCNDHSDCPDDQLCFEDLCVDREEALSDCEDDNDCPDGFTCIEQDHCEEE